MHCWIIFNEYHTAEKATIYICTTFQHYHLLLISVASTPTKKQYPATNPQPTITLTTWLRRAFWSQRRCWTASRALHGSSSTSEWQMEMWTGAMCSVHCKLCFDTGNRKRAYVKYCEGTTNLTLHLKTWHKADYKAMVEKEELPKKPPSILLKLHGAISETYRQYIGIGNISGPEKIYLL